MKEAINKTLNNAMFYRLDDREIKKPMLAIAEFFETHPDLKSIKIDMWQLLIGFMSSDYADAFDKHANNHYLYLFEKLDTLVEAAYILNQRFANNQK